MSLELNRGQLSLPLPSRFDHLDMLRGLAAFLVMAGHVRGYTFQSFAELNQAGVQVGLLARIFYFATGLGHQAVIIFFALSGFLVGGKALGDVLAGKFSWPRYMLRRLTRLWIVIVPALLATFLLDRIGLGLTNGAGYDGRYFNLYALGPRAAAGLDHSLLAFFGNLGFVHTILVPTFGSNGPMWSLANEFWYYVVFPLAAWIVLAPASMLARCAGFVLLVAVLAMLPVSFLEGGLIWAAGAVAAWGSRVAPLAPYLRWTAARVGAVALLLVALVVSKVPSLDIGDLGVGLAVALTLPVIAHWPNPGGAYSTVARAASEVSYTLYLTHYPLLTLIVLAGMAPTRWPPGATGALIYTGLLAAALVWAAIAWWLFERHTDRVYAFVSKRLPAR